MNAVILRATPATLWLALFASTLSLLIAVEGAVMRLYDWSTPPVTMTWVAETLADGRYAVRFSGVKHRADCDLVEIRAWAGTVHGDARLDIRRDGGPINRRHTVGSFGPSVPWILIPPPLGDPRIVAEFDCSGRDVKVEVTKSGTE